MLDLRLNADYGAECFEGPRVSPGVDLAMYNVKLALYNVTLYAVLLLRLTTLGFIT